MKKIVVTGASSEIGAALIKECIAHGIEILALVRNRGKCGRVLPESDLITVIPCQLNELRSVEIPWDDCDVFYHFAWADTEKAGRDDPVRQERNIAYTLDAVQLAHRLGCKKFIGAGSQAEYGIAHDVISPDTPTHPRISYGMAKCAAGQLSGKLCAQLGMAHIWGRIFSVYGRNMSREAMLPYAIGQFLKGEPAQFSAATHMWDFLHEDDVARIFYLLGKREDTVGTYCVADGRSRPLREFILEMRDAFGEGAECVFAEETDATEMVSLMPDVTALRDELGFTPSVEFKEGIADMIGYMKKS